MSADPEKEQQRETENLCASDPKNERRVHRDAMKEIRERAQSARDPMMRKTAKRENDRNDDYAQRKRGKRE